MTAKNQTTKKLSLYIVSKLKYLYLHNNILSDISSLKGLTKLEVLYLDRNSISDISDLSGLTKLRYLFLDSNSISDISSLEYLTNLEFLRLWNNSISDLSPLVKNKGLGRGDKVYVELNPLSATSLDEHIPALRKRRVTVHY